MREIHLNFDLQFSPRFVRAVGVAAIFFAAVPELGSESVTLATYYPAPSGVYTNMITTNNTYLARDGGSVGINMTSPTEQLDVAANVRARGNIYADGTVYWGGGSGPRTEYKNDAGAIASRSGFFQANAPVNYYAGASSWQHLIESRHTNDGNNYALQIAGSFFDQNLYFRKTNNNGGQGWSRFLSENSAGSVSISSHLVLYGGSSCAVVQYNTSGTTTCAAQGYGNSYATNIAGVMAKYAMMPVYRDVGGSTAYGFMLCCPCSTFNGGTCPSL